MKDDLGDRMKMYEGIESDRMLIPRLPIYARLDGRAFSKFTRHMQRPFDQRLMTAMVDTTKYLVQQTHALVGYTQSDEISLAWYHSEPRSESLFGGRIQKLCSVLAGIASAYFTSILPMSEYFGECTHLYEDPIQSFDCRVMNFPNKEECANMFLWREQDATKNAINSLARCFFSHKQLQNKTGKEMQEMLWLHHKVNFNDYPERFKRGTFVRRIVEERILTEEELQNIPEQHRPTGPVTRSKTIALLGIPKFSSITNRVEFIFDGAKPQTSVKD